MQNVSINFIAIPLNIPWKTKLWCQLKWGMKVDKKKQLIVQRQMLNYSRNSDGKIPKPYRVKYYISYE